MKRKLEQVNVLRWKTIDISEKTQKAYAVGFWADLGPTKKRGVEKRELWIFAPENHHHSFALFPTLTDAKLWAKDACDPVIVPVWISFKKPQHLKQPPPNQTTS